MTVDMLAATFFWPEGTVLGSREPHPDHDAETAAREVRTIEEPQADDGFWTAVMRHLWRPSPSAEAR